MYTKIFGQHLFEFYNNSVISKNLSGAKQEKPSWINLAIIMDSPFSFPPTTGFTYRLYNLTKAIQQKNVNVIWIVANRSIKDKADELNLTKYNIPIYVLPEKYFYDKSTILKILNDEKINLVQFESSQTFLEMGIYIKEKLRIPTIIEFHDIESTLRESIDIKDDFDTLNYIQYLSASIADHVICFTKLDYNTLIKKLDVNKNKISIISNGIWEDDFNSTSAFPEKDDSLVFLGNMFYPPNKESLEFIINNILPKVLIKFPKIKLKVIGMTPKELINKYKDRKHLMFLGEIKDKEIYLNELKKSILGIGILLSGSGMKIKILNYAGAGIPVIINDVGMHGYEKLSKLYLVDNNEVSISEFIIKILSNKQDSIVQGQDLKKEVLHNYNWIEISKKYLKILEKVKMYTFKKDFIVHKDFRPFWLQENRIKDNFIQNIIRINI